MTNFDNFQRPLDIKDFAQKTLDFTLDYEELYKEMIDCQLMDSSFPLRQLLHMTEDQEELEEVRF